MKKLHLFLIFGFVTLYSFVILSGVVNIKFYLISDLLASSVFFFALLSGFFIARQNERYNKITDIIAVRDGLYSTLYRIFMIYPRIHSEIRVIIKSHYEKILDNNDWAYNEFHPSATIINLTKVMSSVTDEEADSVKNNTIFDGIWGTIQALQINRKNIIATYQQKLILFQWILIYVFALLTIVSLTFLQTDSFFVDVLKIIFGTAVFLVVVLIKQLDDLSIFGKNFSRNIARDVINILNEVDMKESTNKK